MSTRHYVNAITGAYMGGFDDVEYEDGRVAIPDPPPGAVQVGSGPSGDEQVYLNGAWTNDLLAAKRRRKAEVTALRDAKLAAGFAYGGKLIQIRPEDTASITAMSLVADLANRAGFGWPTGFSWRTSDNSQLELATAAGMLDMGMASQIAVRAIMAVSWLHKDALEAQLNYNAVVAYDITAGW